MDSGWRNNSGSAGGKNGRKRCAAAYWETGRCNERIS